MKVIIFDNGECKLYLHINKIDRTYNHKFSHYTKTSIYLGDDRMIINDFQHGGFNKMIHKFIKSNKNLKIIKIKDMIHESNCVEVTLVDWVSEAMGE